MPTQPDRIAGAFRLALVLIALSLAVPVSGDGEPAPPPHADIVSVNVKGEPGSLTFEVGIESPDTGCEQYANWWEVLDESGTLLLRRVLGHSHVDEQPFVRSAGPIDLDPDRTVWIRAHMHPTGYGGQAMKGSVGKGFQPANLAPDFAAELASRDPLPKGCAF